MTGLLLAAALALAAAPAGAQQPPPAPEPEAPATLLPLVIGDAGVDLAIAGSWSARAAVAAGLLLAPGEAPRPLDGLPGIAPGVSFSQVPDLSVSLTLLERWFVELSVIGGFEGNSLLLGYRGAAGDALRHLLLGTRDIAVAPTPFLETPAQAEGSLGVSARVQAGRGTNEAMVRWDATGELRRLYLGPDELLEERIGPEAWIRGRFLVLPDAGVDGLAVLLEDAAGTLAGGDGRTYRRATLADAIVDVAAGRVTLKAEWTGRVLAFYRKGGLPVGDAALGVDALAGQDGFGRRDITAARVQFRWNMAGTYLGEDLDDRQVLVGADTYLLLWEPGDQSPFQAANAYAFTIDAPKDPARLRASLEPVRAGAAPPEPVLFQADPALKVVSLLVDRDFRAKGRNWYPLHADDPADPLNLLYGPGRDALAGLVGLELVVQALVPVDGYVLGTDAVPSSVRVTVNGLEERRFTLDPSTGRLTFQVAIAASDRIEVRWRTAGASAAGGDLLATWRDDVRLADGLDAWIAAGLRWNVGAGLTAGEPYARSGALVAAAGLAGTAGRLSWSVQAAGSFANPDTTGVVRLHGMEGASIDVDLSEELAWPAAPPDASGPLAALAAADRAPLLYRDHRSYDAFGASTLHDIDWPYAIAIPYGSGGRPGPYTVLGSSAGAATGTSLVLEYGTGTPLADGQWVGVQLPVAAGAAADLSTAKSLSIRMRGVDLAGSVQVHLEIGAIGEDLDADGRLDAEPSATATGFSFDDTAAGAVLKVGAGPRLEGNGRLDTEDRDGNGSLTAEDYRRVVTGGPFVPIGAWDVYTFDFDDADRSKLERARTVRIVVESTAAGTSGRILVDRITIAGSPYWAQAATGTVTIREVAEPFAADDPGEDARLEAVQPGAMRLFHPSGERQEVLETSWSGTGGAPVTVTGFTAKRTGGIVYDEAVAYVRYAGADVPGSLSFALLDAGGRGLRWTLADSSGLADQAWHELRASLGDGTVTLDGVTAPGTAAADADYGEPALLQVDFSGSDAGLLYLDEVHLRSPRAAFGAGLRASASWSRPGATWAPGGVRVLADLDVAEDLAAATAGFAPLYGIPASVADLSSRTRLSAEVLYARLALEAVLRATADGFSASGSHRLQVPAAASPVTFTDSFAVAASGEFTRADGLDIRFADALAISLAARATGTAQALAQEWTAALDARPLERLDLGLDLRVAQSAAGYPLAGGWYGARWIREAALMAPWHGGEVLERGQRLAATAAADLGAVAATLSIEASAVGSAYDAAGRSQEDRVDQDWSLSWRSSQDAARAVTVTLRYARSLAMDGARGTGTPFGDEAAAFFSRLADQGWFLLGIPVAEIFLDDAARILPAWDGLASAAWSPSTTLSVERRPGSRPADLLVPSNAELTLSRRLERDGDLAADAVSVRPRLVWRALNLFGRLGSHPLVDFYRTDEYRVALGASFAGTAEGDATGVDGVILGLAEIGLELYADFLGFRDEDLALAGTVTLGEDVRSARADLQATFAWSSRPEGGVRLPLVPAEVAAGGYFEHRETLDLDVAAGENAKRPLAVLLGHATRLVYPGRGSIEAGIRVGNGAEDLGDARATRLGVEASLEAKLTF